MPVKVAVIGAGSIGFTRRLMGDILMVPELQDTEFAFHDARATLGHLIEIYEPSPPLRDFYAHVRGLHTG